MMRIAVFVALVLSAVFTGFLFAGFPGATLFGFLLTAAWGVLKRKPLSEVDAGWVLKRAMLSVAGYMLMTAFGLLGSDRRLHVKIADIRRELEGQGHRPTWFIISQRRSQIYNAVLANSVKRSKHLRGRAIDLFVVDADGNGNYDRRDFELIREASARCERRNPGYSGAVYDYLDRKSRLTRHMVHVELG
jgi:hypothetical protein